MLSLTKGFLTARDPSCIGMTEWRRTRHMSLAALLSPEEDSIDDLEGPDDEIDDLLPADLWF